MDDQPAQYPIDYVTFQGKTSSTWTVPPLDGSLTYPELLHWHGKRSANHAFVVLAAEKDEEEETIISWREASNAMFRFAAELQELVGADLVNGKPPVIGILAYPESLTYVTWVCAIVAAGYTAFPLSPRNSIPAFKHLLETANCQYLIGTVAKEGQPAVGLQQVAAVLLQQIPGLKLLDAPKYNELYPRLAHWPASPYDPTGDPDFDFHPKRGGIDSPLFILHSSGSTSFPKPIPMYNDAWLTWGRSQWYQDHDMCGTRWAIMSLPSFHIGGLSLALCSPVCSGTAAVFFRPLDPPPIPTAQTILESIRLSKAHFVFAVPSVCVEWSQDPRATEILSECLAVKYGGGPLPEEFGHLLVARGVKLQVAYGMTEAAAIFKGDLSTRLGPKDWMYAPFMPYIRAELIPEGNNAYRLVVMETKNYKLSASNYEADVRAYDTNDLLEPHPTVKGYYKIIGRADDQIMMSNGEKTNPGPLEHIIVANPHVVSATIFGRARPQVGVIIEPVKPINTKDHAELADFRNLIWPDIEKANAYAPQHSRIFKEFILVADPVNKPLPRTPKRTIARNAMLQLYAEEIEAIYAAAEQPMIAGWARPPEVWDEVDIHHFVQRVVNGVMRENQPDACVDNSRDLFEQGCDSLQATYIRAAIANALQDASKKDNSKKIIVQAIPHNLVFLHPTVDRLAAYVIQAIQGQPLPAADGPNGQVKEMIAMVEQYTMDFPSHQVSSMKEEGEVVLLTGTTGTLGTYILQQLLDNPHVKNVYALNRPNTGKNLRTRQSEALVDRGMSNTLLDSPKLTLLEGDTAAAALGLDVDVFNPVKAKITAIIHNAWRLDFNLSLLSFESHLKGMRNLIDLALAASGPSPAQFIFISSIGSVANWRESHPVPEDIIDDPTVALGNGYGQSKWVSERVLLAAAKQRGLPATIWRVGQLSGSSINGAWNTTDWVPIIAESGTVLGALPSNPGMVDWLPTDKAASAVVDSLLTPPQSGKTSRYLNLVHPKPTKWNDIFEPMSKNLGVPLIPFDVWVHKVQQQADSGGPSAAERIPAIKLLDFLGRFTSAGTPDSGNADLPLKSTQATFETTKAVQTSETLRDLSELNEADVENWLEYWRHHGLFA